MSDDAPRPYIEAWGCYEAFRKLGFSDEQVSLVYGPVLNPETGRGGEQLYVRLDAQKREFVYVIGPLEEDRAGAMAIIDELWRRIRERDIEDDELECMWRSTEIGGNTAVFSVLALKLREKGFVLPALTV